MQKYQIYFGYKWVRLCNRALAKLDPQGIYRHRLIERNVRWVDDPYTGLRVRADVRDAYLPPIKDLATLLVEWERTKTYHVRSTTRAAALEMLHKIRPDGGWQGFSAAVLFASAPFETRAGHLRNRAMLQLLAFLDVVEFLRREAPGTEIPMFAQDPAYGPLDKALLANLGVQVVENPVGQQLVGRDTFGFVAGCYMDLDWAAQCIHLQPRLMVGNPVEEYYSHRLGEAFVRVAPDADRYSAGDIRRGVHLREFAARHYRVAWPELDPETVGEQVTAMSGGLDVDSHNIECIWFERPEAAAQMAGAAGQETCDGCRAGVRHAWDRAPAVGYDAQGRLLAAQMGPRLTVDAVLKALGEGSEEGHQ
ncbi:hypothetical protein LTR53_010203 [Teratosphaeriaceae sp. CCFEE 6253]|nr:hypothetical protein LTR53_010203 [Teratosphaeriaceae sp. CCFEE 6253]